VTFYPALIFSAKLLIGGKGILGFEKPSYRLFKDDKISSLPFKNSSDT